LSLAGTIQPAPEALRQARWHRHLGDAYMGLGRLRESREHADQAVALLGYPVPATPVRLLGDLARGPGISAVLHQINLAERTGPSPELARAYATMSVAAGLVQLHALARSYARRALEIARAEDDLAALAFVLVATSAYHISMGNWTTSHKALFEGLEVAQRLGDQRRWGELAIALAQLMYYQGQFDRLADWQAEMQTMASHADDPQRKAHVILARVWFLMPQGRMDIAVKELPEATTLLAGRGSRADEILTYGVLALAHLRH
jgi:tetratricopeptide (TPR) repeat protein